MKINNSILKFSAIILIFFAVVSSCTKDNTDPVYSYYVSKEFSVSYNKNYINNLIDNVSGQIPDVDHSNGVIPCMLQSVLFLTNLSNSDLNLIKKDQK